MTTIDVIMRSLAEQQQNVIGLTEPNYDASPFIFVLTQPIKFKKTITIEKRTVASDVLIWDHDTQGNWDEQNWSPDAPAFILGHPDYGKLGESELGGVLSAWTEVEVIESTNYNNNGFATMIEALKNIWDYLAYGTGSVTDNATSLVSEEGRVDSPEIEEFDNYFNLIFTLDELEGNGLLIKEYGLATESTGDISTTDIYAPIDKSNLIYITVYVQTILENF